MKFFKSVGEEEEEEEEDAAAAAAAALVDEEALDVNRVLKLTRGDFDVDADADAIARSIALFAARLPIFPRASFYEKTNL